MFRIFTSLLALALYVSAVSTCAPAQEPPPPEGAPIPGNPYGEPSAQGATTTTATNRGLLVKAKSWFAHLQAGSIDRSQMEAGPNANLNDATVANAQKMIGSLGTPVSFVQERTGTQGNITYGIYSVTFHNGEKVDFLFAIDSQGKVASLGLGSPR